VQLVFKHMPLSMHSKAPGAHAAAEAANRQGKFWEFHDKIFANSRQLDDATYLKYAEELDLNIEQFKKDQKSAQVKSRIDADVAQAGKLGVTGTPAFYINGRFLSGAQPFASFKRVIDEELAKN
jgi:protein-disulfide isomerase